VSTLDKQLARLADECRRLDADHWRLALTNGHELSVSAKHDEGFLLLDADAGVDVTAKNVAALAERSCEFPATVKLGLRRGSPRARLRAELALPDEDDAAAERIREYLEGMRGASHRLQTRDAAPTVAKANGDASDLATVLKEAGWQYHERAGGALLADLETGNHFLQAEAERRGAGACFRVTLYRSDAAVDETTRQTLSLYLLEANAALRCARGFLRPEGEGIAAGFEVSMETAPSAAETSHALAALSVAGRKCARELKVLGGSVAGIYRSAHPSFNHQTEGA